MVSQRRQSAYECTGYVLSPRAVVHGTLLVSEEISKNLTFPEGISGGLQRTCTLTVEGPPFPQGAFEARVEVPRIGQWLLIRITPTRLAGPQVEGRYVIANSGRLES